MPPCATLPTGPRRGRRCRRRRAGPSGLFRRSGGSSRLAGSRAGQGSSAYALPRSACPAGESGGALNATHRPCCRRSGQGGERRSLPRALRAGAAAGERGWRAAAPADDGVWAVCGGAGRGRPAAKGRGGLAFTFTARSPPGGAPAGPALRLLWPRKQAAVLPKFERGRCWATPLRPMWPRLAALRHLRALSPRPAALLLCRRRAWAPPQHRAQAAAVASAPGSGAHHCYRTLAAAGGQAATVVKKSKFTASAASVASPDAALAFIQVANFVWLCSRRQGVTLKLGTSPPSGFGACAPLEPA